MKPYPKKFSLSKDIIIIALQKENKRLRQENEEYKKFIKAQITALRKAQESFDKGVFKRSDLES